MKRRILKLTVFLLLGAVVNVAVAWGCATRSNSYIRLPKYSGHAAEGERSYFERMGWQQATYGEGLRCVFWEFRQIGLGLVDTTFSEAVIFEDSGKLVLGGETAVRTEAGWPLLSLCGEKWKCEPQWPAVWRYRTAVQPPDAVLGLRLASYRVLPFGPIWPSFAINTIFYAALIWILTLGPFTARRMIRRKRGLCAKCGYDLRGASGGGDVCPECGASGRSRRALLGGEMTPILKESASAGVPWA